MPDEPDACVICLEAFLPPVAEEAHAEALAEPVSALGVLDIDTDIKNKNKSKKKTIFNNVEEPVGKGDAGATDSAILPLDFLGEVASLSGCDHKYHDKCIKEWSSVTNSTYPITSRYSFS